MRILAFVLPFAMAAWPQEPPAIKDPEGMRTCLRLAMDAAASLKSDYLQSQLMAEIAEVQARAGWADDALRTLEDMTYDYEQSLAYAAVGRELGKVGLVEQARKILEKGLEEAGADELDFLNSNAYGHLAVAFASIGDFTKALRSAPEQSSGPNSFALKSIVRILAKTGRVDRALKVAASMGNDAPSELLLEAVEELLKEERLKAVPELASRIERMETRSRARELYANALAARREFDEADRVADSIESRDPKLRAMTSVGLARVRKDRKLADPARIASAEKLLGPMESPGLEIDLRLALAKWHAALGDLAAARRQIDAARARTTAVEDSWLRGYRLVMVAETLAEVGLDDAAMAQAKSFPEDEGGHRDSAMKAIAVAQAGRGRLDTFTATLKGCTDPTRRAEAHLEAARNRTRAGDKEGALRLLRACHAELKGIDVGFKELNDLRNGTPEFSLLLDLLDAFAEAGDLDQALAVALKGEKDQRGGSVGGMVVRKMARHQVAAGRAKAALEWIRQIKDPSARCLASVGAAEGYLPPATR